MKILLAGNAVTANILSSYLRRDVRYDVVSCVVDDVFVERETVGDCPTVGLSDVQKACSPENHRIIMSMGYNDLNRVRESIYLRLKALGYGVETYVHPDARVYTDHALGEGAVVLPGAVIEPNARVGANTMVWSNVTLAHDSSVGDHCWVAAGTVLSGQATVLRNTFVGVGSTIVNKVVVGEYNIVGAGALISRDTKPHSVHLARSAEPFRYSSDDYVKHFKFDMNKKLADLLADVFGVRPTDITPELEKSEVDSWDSLKQMDLVMSLEREYGITLDIPDIVRITSVAAIISVLNDKGVTLQIDGTLALVTGAAQGLGLAIAQFLAAAGARVVAVDVNAEALAALPEGLNGVVMDVTDPDQVKSAVADVVERHGPIGILVNNAGVIFSEPFVNVMKPEGIMHDYGRFRQSLAVNLDSVFIVTSAVVEHMVKRRVRGVIVNISSISACGNEGQTAYSAAKAGVNAMTVTWAKELGRWGIRANAVAPGFIGTPSTRAALNESALRHIQSNTPLRRLGEAEEVAMAVAALVENDFINGLVLDVNGGLRI